MQEFLATFKPNGLTYECISVCYGLAENTLTGTSWAQGLVLVDKSALENGQVVIRETRRWRDAYTLTEGTVALVSCGSAKDACREATMVAIVDPETLLEVPPGQVGEIWLHGSSKAQGYFRRPEATLETFGARLKGHSCEFLRTGDSGFVHNDELYFCSRIKDIVIINGLNYYPQDMERTAESCHDALRAGCSAAFALKQENDLTECAVLVAELKPGVPASKYEEIVEKIISAVSMEQGLYLTAVCLLKTKSIPKTTSGKISRAACCKAFLAKQLAVVHQWDDLEVVLAAAATPAVKSAREASVVTPEPPANNFSLGQVKQRITQMVLEVGKLDSVRTDAVLLDVGLTSSATTELSGRLSKEFGVKVRPTMLFTSPTIDDISLRLLELIAAANSTNYVTVALSLENERASIGEPLQLPQQVEEEEEEEGPFAHPEAFIAGWGIAVPFPLSSERFLEIDREQRRKLGQPQEVIDQMATLVKASRIHNRHTCHAAFLPKDKKPSDYPDAVGTVKEDIYKTDSNPPLYTRIACYKETCVELCIAAAEKAVRHWGKDRGTITHILTTCTSGWSEPGIGCGVVKALGLSQDIQKAELNFNGCFCGATCLRLARDLIRAGECNAVLIVACEVASSHYDWTQLDTERMIAQSLFADGAASIVMAKEGVWKYSQTGSSILPDSGHLLGLRPPHHEDEHIYCMTLSKMVPPALYAYFTDGHGKNLIDKLYKADEVKPALAIHPGGPRILEAMGDVFYELGWKDDALQASYDTFGNYGNLGSAAMLFVLANRLTKGDIVEDKLITMAFGPGVTVEYAQLERATATNSNAALSAAAKRRYHNQHNKLLQPSAQRGEKDVHNVVATKTNVIIGGDNRPIWIYLMLQTVAMMVFGVYFLQQSVKNNF